MSKFGFLIVLATFLFFLNPEVRCSHVLFFHNVASYSHRVVTYPLANALEERGHKVTIISPFAARHEVNPNITDIVPKKLEKAMANFLGESFDTNMLVKKQGLRLVHSLLPNGLTTCEALLTSPELQQFFATTDKLDLVIMDNNMAECGMAIVYKYGAKHAYFNTVVYLPYEYDFLGLGAPDSSAVPELEVGSPKVPMNFFGRVFNTKNLHVPDMPFVDDLARNASLILYSGDPVTDYPRAHPPMVINVGGIHLANSNKPLQQEIDIFINGSSSAPNDGFVYISLGSLAVSSDLPEEVKSVFYSTIKAFPQLRFLWKWNGDFPTDLPKNLYLAKWFPQEDVLAHPKIRAFVTQGGRPSTYEGLYYEVPMITFPVLGDQDFNCNRGNKMGYNIALDLGSVTVAQFKDAVTQAVYDKGMKERVKELRKIFMDQPETPLERAVWWTEYVLRHRDVSHLRPEGFDQFWFQRRLLDVWAFLFTCILLSVLVVGALLVSTTKYLLKSAPVNMFLADKTKLE